MQGYSLVVAESPEQAAKLVSEDPRYISVTKDRKEADTMDVQRIDTFAPGVPVFYNGDY